MPCWRTKIGMVQTCDNGVRGNPWWERLTSRFDAQTCSLRSSQRCRLVKPGVHVGQQAVTARGRPSINQFAQPAQRNKKHQWLAVESGEAVMQIKIRRCAVFGVDEERPGRNIGAR